MREEQRSANFGLRPRYSPEISLQPSSGGERGARKCRTRSLAPPDVSGEVGEGSGLPKTSFGPLLIVEVHSYARWRPRLISVARQRHGTLPAWRLAGSEETMIPCSRRLSAATAGTRAITR